MPNAAPSRTIFPWVQGLRALSALAIAFYHVGHDAIINGGDPRGIIKALTGFMPWQAGVDVFFVISGFVIVHASGSLFGRAGAASVFVRRRLTRIVPLYWIMTTAFLAVLWLNPTQINGDIGGPAYLLASYLFIPWPRPDGLVQPAFGLGWTLNYEMLFYGIVTPFLGLRRGLAVSAVIACCCVLVAGGRAFGWHNPQLAFWSNGIILEFAAGMLLAQLLARGVRLGRMLRYAMVVLAIIALHFGRATGPALRPLEFGVPALLLVAAACLGAPSRFDRRAGILVLLGDASYAMYLLHPFVMRGLTILWHRFHIADHVANELAGVIYVAAGLAVAQGGAVLLHLLVERKLYRMLRRRSGVLTNEAV